MGEVGDILSTNSYSYTANDPINRMDPSGYKWDWNKIAKVTAVAIIATAIITVTAVYVTPVCPTCSTTIIGGVAGASAQMISNIAHDNDEMNNVAGAAVGGAMMGLTGNPLQAGLANAIVNQTENLINNQEISVTNLLTDTVSYSLLNLFPVTQFTGKTGNELIYAGMAAIGIDALGFYDTEAIQSFIPQITIQIDYHQIRYVVGGEVRGEFIYD